MKTIFYAIRVATQFQNDGKLSEAKAILNAILEADSKQPDALHLLGIITYQSGDIHLAINYIEQAIDNNPIVALYHSNLGEMHRQLKAIDTSIRCGERAIALDSCSATALSNLAIAYFDAKQFEQAENYHKRALSINPNLACSLNNLGSIYKAYEKPQEAIAFYQAAMKAAPHFIEPINNLGMLLLSQENYPTALQLFEKALELNPHCAESQYGLAKMYFLKHDFVLAEYTTKKALEMYSQRVEFYQLLAEIYCEQGKHVQALLSLDQALAMYSTNADLLLNKGYVLLEMGEIANATEQFLKIIDDPDVDNRVLAQYSLVNLHKIKSDSLHLKALLSIAASVEKVSFDKREYIYFSLGKCYDDLGEWKKAFAYFREGCKLKRNRIRYDIRSQYQFEEKLMRCYTTETINYLRTFANLSPRPIFIVGMPRSGTTLVEQILSRHPDVYGAGELPFLMDLIQAPFRNGQIKIDYPDNILQFSSNDFHAITNQYLSHLKNIVDDVAYVTDKMPQNFIAIGLIHALFPNAKIIHVKRNPIDTCLSCYTKLFRQGQLYSYDLMELGHYYLSYERIMNHWRTVLPQNAWLDVTYENVIENINHEAKRMTDYCHLTWNEACLTFYESKRQVRTASFLQVRNPIYASSINRWKRFENELEPLVKLLN